MIKLIYRNDNPQELLIPKEVLPEGGIAQPHHFLSTPGDNLIELAGRVCYDSAASTTKTRGTKEYHQHIHEVKHGSVQEHCNITIQIKIDKDTEFLLALLLSIGHRPGFRYEINTEILRITYNIRAINDWDIFDTQVYWCNSEIRQKLKSLLIYHAKTVCPYAVIGEGKNFYESQKIQPTNLDEIWLSFYISDVSRGFSHEWVRHKFHTAVSQRSTRYVDESESDWAWHPLLEKYGGIIMGTGETEHGRYSFTTKANCLVVASECRRSYSEIVKILEAELIASGIDKFTARKQARGAARGILGNALSTEMVWSASLDQIIRIINQRASDGADGEIRLVANDLFDIVAPLYPKVFAGYEKTPCKDGIGYNIINKNN